jgi:tetratricopeptide (TPR) repeat protein
MAVGAGGGTWAALPAGRATAAVEEPKGAFERGVEFHKSGHHDFAAIAFMKAGEENRDGRAYACAAYCHALSSLTTNTLACANRAEELGYTGVDLNVVRAYCHMRATDYQEALAECDRALRRVPNCRAALLIKSVVQIRQHERDGGRPPLDRQVLTDLYAVTTTPGPITGAVWLFAAKAHLFQSDRSPDDVTRAINAVREAVRLRAKHTVLGTRSIHDTLAPDPRYQDALATAPLSNPPTRVNPYLICPIPD